MREGNIFFIQSPLQLLVAQQIINQEKLTVNVMIFGYIHQNRHFLDIYDLVRIDDMWTDRVYMEKIAGWGLGSIRSLRRDCKLFKKNYELIASLVAKYKIRQLFLGDMGNGIYHLIDYLFIGKGLDICFFEEGSGHYVQPNSLFNRNQTAKVFVAKWMYGLMYYKPFYGIDNLYFKNASRFKLENLPMTKRYSIVPFYNEDFDILIKPDMTLMSERLKNYLTSELCHEKPTSAVLLMTTVFDKEGYIDFYYQAIEHYLSSIDKDTDVYVKFHPRETEATRAGVLEIFKRHEIAYHLLGGKYNVPVEFYLQFFYFREICVFFTSTAFYNGYLFEETKFVYLIKTYYELCKRNNADGLDELEKMIDLIPAR